MHDTRVISLGGSIVAPERVDRAFLVRLREALLGYLEGDPGRRLILVYGGGGPAREYQQAFREIQPEASADSLDWIGIAATRLNAELLRQLLLPQCPEPVVTDPTAISVFPGRILVAAGWKPGFSTDTDAVLLAERFQAETLLNLSNIPKVYSADPRTDPQARPLDLLSWSEFQALVGEGWTPGLHAPFDPVASGHALKIRLRVVIASGRDIPNWLAILEGRPFEGTVIGPD